MKVFERLSKSSKFLKIVERLKFLKFKFSPQRIEGGLRRFEWFSSLRASSWRSEKNFTENCRKLSECRVNVPFGSIRFLWFLSVSFDVSLKLNCHSQRKLASAYSARFHHINKQPHNTFFHIKLSVRIARQCGGRLNGEHTINVITPAAQWAPTTRMPCIRWSDSREDVCSSPRSFFNNKKIWKTRRTLSFPYFLSAVMPPNVLNLWIARCVRGGLKVASYHEAHSPTHCQFFVRTWIWLYVVSDGA